MDKLTVFDKGGFLLTEDQLVALEELQTNLDHWLMKYNEHRPHSGRHCYGKTPRQTFRETTHIALEKSIPAPELSDSEALQSVAG